MSEVKMDGGCPELLRQLGLRDELLLQAQQFMAPGLCTWPMRVVADRGAELELLGVDGPRRGVLSGRLRHEASEQDKPCVGDWVLVSEHAEMLRIEQVLPRQGLFARKSAGDTSAVQPIAANVDLAVIVVAFAPPGSDPHAVRHAMNPHRIERYRLAAAQAGARALLVLNKADLCEDAAERAQVVAAELGVEALVTSTATGLGLAELRLKIAEAGCAVLVGSSGVGKSSLTNQLIGEATQTTAEVRGDDLRGRHTTSHRELFPLGTGGCLIDTPGMREFSPVGDTPEDLAFAAELQSWGQACRFRDCQHGGEPGCAVQEAVLQGKLDRARLEHHLQLLREVNQQRGRQDTRARAESRKRERVGSKSLRNLYKRRGQS